MGTSQSEPPGPPRLGFVPGLEGLRAAAVLMVVVSHLPVVLATERPSWRPTGGFLGVDLFFVLSGFLITTLILEEQRASGALDLRRFFVRRALRLLPAVYLLLAFNIVYVLVAGLDLRSTLNSTRDVVLYIANWSMHWHGYDVDARLGHLWSLSIEEQFYVLWAVGMAGIVGLRQHRDVALAVTEGLIVLVIVQRLRLLGDGVAWLDLYSRTDTRADGLLIGALLAQLRFRWAWRPSPRAMATATVIALAALSVILWVTSPMNRMLYQLGFTVTAGLYAVVVFSTVDGPLRTNRLLTCRPALVIGRLSYGIYLWHLPVFMIVARHRAAWPAEVRLLVAVPIVAMAVAASWFLVERPALGMRDRWSGKRRRTQPPQPRPDPLGVEPPAPATG